MSRDFLIAGVILAGIGSSFCTDDSRPLIVPTRLLNSLQVTGNTQGLDVNQTVQLTVMANWSDGSRRDVSSETSWRSFNPAVATVSSTGLLTTVAPGRTGAQAQYQTAVANFDVLVLPAGTFIVRGTVTEAGGFRIAQARVDVVGGPHSGRSAITTANGTYEIYGLSGDLKLQAVKDAYLANTRDVSVTANQAVDFELRPIVPPLAIAGNYRLTFTASTRCASQLPDDARMRTYAALVNQDAVRILVNLAGAPFATEPRTGQGNYFFGAVRSNTVAFTIGFDYFYYQLYDVVEQLAPTTYLTIGGAANGTATSTTIAGTLTGTFSVWEAPNGFYASSRRGVASCNAPDHQFSFIR